MRTRALLMVGILTGMLYVFPSCYLFQNPITTFAWEYDSLTITALDTEAVILNVVPEKYRDAITIKYTCDDEHIIMYNSTNKVTYITGLAEGYAKLTASIEGAEDKSTTLLVHCIPE